MNLSFPIQERIQIRNINGSLVKLGLICNKQYIIFYFTYCNYVLVTFVILLAMLLTVTLKETKYGLDY